MAEVNGYHLWALPDDSVREFDEGITFTELSNDLSDGYRARTLFGSENGVRTFKLRMNTLAHSDIGVPTVTGINGESVSREDYIWSLFCETKVSGEPFVYQSRRNGQYYLVEFADKTLTYSGMMVKLFATGIELRQVRIQGQSVFNPLVIPNVEGWFDGDVYTPTSGIRWTNQVSPTNYLDDGGDVLAVASHLNGHSIMRLNSVAGNGLFAGGMSWGLTVREAWFVMKMREATFSNYGGILTSTTIAALIGDSGTTKFFNQSLGSTFEYRLNNVLYAESDMQAPMNEWGIVHIRYPASFGLAEVQVGQDRNDITRRAKLDIAAFITTSQLVSAAVRREIYEYLSVRFQVSIA